MAHVRINQGTEKNPDFYLIEVEETFQELEKLFTKSQGFYDAFIKLHTIEDGERWLIAVKIEDIKGFSVCLDD